MANLLQRWPFTKHQLWKELVGFDLLLISVSYLLSIHLAARLFILRFLFNSHHYMHHPQTCVCRLLCCFSLHLNWLFFLCRSHLAVDMAGGASERTAGWCLRRVSRGSPGSDQAIRPAAADHPAGNSQCYKGRRGPHTTAQVIIY